MYCVVKCIVRGNQACVKNADLRHPSRTVVMYRRKSVSPVHNVLINTEFIKAEGDPNAKNSECISGGGNNRSMEKAA
jgi:hypothetical protein